MPLCAIFYHATLCVSRPMRRHAVSVCSSIRPICHVRVFCQNEYRSSIFSPSSSSPPTVSERYSTSYGVHLKQEVWPSSSADTVCPRPPLMTQYSILSPELRRSGDETYRRCEFLTLTFALGGHRDLKTGMPVASKVGNLPSKFGQARPWLLELFAMYATDVHQDGQTDGRTDKSNVYCPLPYGRGHNKSGLNLKHKTTEGQHPPRLIIQQISILEFPIS